MPGLLLTKSELTVLAAKSDQQEALCRRLFAETRLPIYQTFANRHQTKAAKKRDLSTRAPLTASVDIEPKGK